MERKTTQDELKEFLATLAEPEKTEFTGYTAALTPKEVSRFLRLSKEDKLMEVFIASLPPDERAAFESLDAPIRDDQHSYDTSKMLNVVQVPTLDNREIKRMALELEKTFGLSPSLALEITQFQVSDVLECAVENMGDVVKELVNQKLDEWIIEGMEEKNKALWIVGKFFHRGLNRLNLWMSQTEWANAHGYPRATPCSRKKTEDWQHNDGNNLSTEFGRGKQDCEKYRQGQLRDHHSRRIFMPKQPIKPQI